MSMEALLKTGQTLKKNVALKTKWRFGFLKHDDIVYNAIVHDYKPKILLPKISKN